MYAEKKALNTPLILTRPKRWLDTLAIQLRYSAKSSNHRDGGQLNPNPQK
jgi:hypothetical protein